MINIAHVLIDTILSINWMLHGSYCHKVVNSFSSPFKVLFVWCIQSQKWPSRLLNWQPNDSNTAKSCIVCCIQFTRLQLSQLSSLSISTTNTREQFDERQRRSSPGGRTPADPSLQPTWQNISWSGPGLFERAKFCKLSILVAIYWRQERVIMLL